jgi:hypothetical protein
MAYPKVVTALLMGWIPLLTAPLAHADGIAECKESPDQLNAMAERTIEMIRDKVPLGPYENAGTVLQFVNSSMSGIDFQMPCADIMAIYATQRINGQITAPTGPGLK